MVSRETHRFFLLTLNKINIEARKKRRAYESGRDSCLVLLLIFKPIFFSHFEDRLKYRGEEKF